MPYAAVRKLGRKIYIPVVMIGTGERRWLKKIWFRARDADIYANAVNDRYWRLKRAVQAIERQKKRDGKEEG